MGNRIREIRDDRGMSQAALGACIGHDAMYVSRLERQKRRLGVDVLYDLATCLECHPAELLDDSVAIKADAIELINGYYGLSDAQRPIARRLFNALEAPSGKNGGENQ